MAALNPWHLHGSQLARDSAWVNAVLQQFIDVLVDADDRRDVGLFSRRIHGTRHHFLVAALRWWCRRFGEGVSPRVKWDAEPEPNRQALGRRWREGAVRLEPLIQAWSADRFDRTHGPCLPPRHASPQATHRRPDRTGSAMPRPRPRVFLSAVVSS